MKEFEKWWNNRFPGNKEHHKIYNYTEPKEAWKAALEWVYKEMDSILANRKFSAHSAITIIKKELSDK